MTDNPTYPHYSPGAKTNHFVGLCDECDSHYLAKKTFGEVEDWYHRGMIGQDAYEAYRWVWATSPAHEGYRLSVGWTDPPVTERAVTIGKMIRSASRS